MRSFAFILGGKWQWLLTGNFKNRQRWRRTKGKSVSISLWKNVFQVYRWGGWKFSSDRTAGELSGWKLCNPVHILIFKKDIYMKFPRLLHPKLQDKVAKVHVDVVFDAKTGCTFFCKRGWLLRNCMQTRHTSACKASSLWSVEAESLCACWESCAHEQWNIEGPWCPTLFQREQGTNACLVTSKGFVLHDFWPALQLGWVTLTMYGSQTRHFALFLGTQNTHFLGSLWS